MRASTVMKWITGGLEACLAIPVLGGLIVVANGWVPLLIMLMLHVATLFLATREQTNKRGSILGILTSMVAVIPILGFIMHLITAMILLADASREQARA